MFVGQVLKSIQVGEYITDKRIIGDSFIVKPDIYSGIVIKTEKNGFTFFNEGGGRLWINNSVKFPNPQKWILKQNGN